MSQGVQVELLSFDRLSVRLHDAVDIYVRVWQRNREASLIFVRRSARYPHFRGYLARVNGETVGMVFGTASLPGQWWHDNVALEVGREHPALQGAWVLAELAVLASYRGQGIGGRLHDAVLNAQPLSRVLLSTQKANSGARRFYERRGWSYLHAGFSFNPGRPPYVIMQQSL